VYSGTRSIKVAETGWGALSVHNGPWTATRAIDPARYQSVQFRIYTASSFTVGVRLENDARAAFPEVVFGQGKTPDQIVTIVGRLAMAEAMAMAKKAGVPLDTLYQTLKTCTADSRLLRALEGAVVRGEYPPVTFHAVKDLSAAVDSGRSVQQAMPVTSLSLALYQLADDQLGGLRTSTEVVRYFLED